MSEHFIKNIEIKNYKCFDDFKAEGFQRVNLIGGKNNVGKTAFMEACYINARAKDIENFTTAMIDIKFMRESINILEILHQGKKHSDKDAIDFMELSDGIRIKSNKRQIEYKIESGNGSKKYIFQLEENKYLKISSNDFTLISKWMNHIRFISTFGLNYSQMIYDYSNLQKQDKEKYLNDILKSFDNNIEAFKIIHEKPQCKIDKKYLEISELGDGTRHLVSIIISLFSCKDGYLFIDEIDNGIHYTQLDDVWKIILQISKKLDVQIFATTHSKECIESYARVSKELEDEEVSFIKLTKLQDNSIIAGVRDYEMLQYSIEDGHEVRGW
jgi:AAA15 family ATPase/GTPase